MHIASYSFTCRFDSAVLLPQYKGSTLRGGLGHALRKISCALRRRECGNCLLATNCAYAFLFEVSESSGKVPIAHRPHPYVITPPETEQRFFHPGQSFSFGISLFGRANSYLPHLVYAVQEMGRQGLGKKSEARGDFTLECVTSDQEILFQKDGILTHPVELSEITVGEQPASSPKAISITCRTPLRLKQRNRLQNDLSFGLLIRAVLRRISSLEHSYGHGEPNLDYKGLAARASRVRTVAADCRWVEIERYSSRQKTGMLMGGLQGRLVYEDQGLAEFLPLLRYCERTHLGKQTSFGLGQIEVHIEETQ